MGLPSRRLPPRRDSKFPGLLLAGVLLAGFGYVFLVSSNPVRCLAVLAALALYAATAFLHGRERRRLEGMRHARAGESLCRFARSFDTRRIDTWVIRAAHQEIQQLLKPVVPAFPVRASDRLLHDLNIDLEDVEDLVAVIAARSGHSLDATERNPYYGKIDTVSDLVLFIDAQPRP